ncbi:hypothetical protein JTB14_033479 [Gonioctena quinquepunctata]|nr:hypothetical protein JTB14_033479 [Gonioctena quinquepunctata]
MNSALEGANIPPGIDPDRLADLDNRFLTEFVPILDLIPSFQNILVSLVQSQVQAALAQQKLDFDNKFDCHIPEFAKRRQEFEAIKNELSSLKHLTKNSPVLLGVDGWLPETNTTSKTYQPPPKESH